MIEISLKVELTKEAYEKYTTLGYTDQKMAVSLARMFKSILPSEVVKEVYLNGEKIKYEEKKVERVTTTKPGRSDKTDERRTRVSRRSNTRPKRTPSKKNGSPIGRSRKKTK